MEIKIEKQEILPGMEQKDPSKDGFVVRIRGLPWSASKDEILKFFENSAIQGQAQGIHLTMSKEGRPSGEAYIELETEDDYNSALTKDNEHLGNRYIEVFQATKDEMDWALRRCGLDGDEAFGDACVRLRGLPFGCSKEEIAQFFTGLEIVRNGITLPTDFQGRSTGEAYVQFATQDIAEKAMGKHKEKIGHRYIEIFKSSLQEIRSAMGMGPMRMRNMGTNRLNPYDRMDRPGTFGGGSYGMGRGRGMAGKTRFGEGLHGNYGMYDGYGGPGGRRGGGAVGGYGGDRFGYGRGREDYGTGHRIHMRGLPYRAIEWDVCEFFSPLNPVSVDLKFGANGRATGEADVEFNSHDDAVKAMKRDKEKMQHRYIELFLHSSPEPFRRNEGYDNMGNYGNQSEDFGMDRSFSGRGRPFPGDGERPYTADRGFGQAGDRSFGPTTGDRGFGRGGYPATGGSDYGFSGGDRSFGQGAGGVPAGNRQFNATGDRSFNNMGGGGGGNTGGGSGDFRNGMNTAAGGNNMASGGGGGYRNDGGGYGNTGTAGTTGHGGFSGQDPCKDDSEFYGSGKLFGDNNYQQQGMQQGMMGGNNYTSF